MATANQRLVGRVAQILNARELVINLGKQQGVGVGMRFAVLTEPIEIRDPETGEVLDTLEREKTRVEARTVRDRISVCRTYRTSEVPVRTPLGDSVFTDPVDDSFAYLNESEWKNLDAADEYVKVGDRVATIEKRN